MPPQFDCVLRPTEDTPSLLLKELALFYDKIYLLPVPASGIYPQTWSALQSGSPEGTLSRPIDFLRDTHRLAQLPIDVIRWKDPKMPELLAYLRERRIVESIDVAPGNTPEDLAFRKSLRELERLVAGFDVSDLQFNTLCNASPQDYVIDSGIVTTVRSIPSDPNPIEMTIHIVPEPKPIEISFNVTESLTTAESLGAFPVFDNSLRPVVEYRFRVAQSVLRTLPTLSNQAQLTLDERAKFSDIVLTLSSELFQSKLIGDLDARQLVHYRNTRSPPRTRPNPYEPDYSERTAWPARANCCIE
jgi:hypothetical protein